MTSPLQTAKRLPAEAIWFGPATRNPISPETIPEWRKILACSDDGNFLLYPDLLLRCEESSAKQPTIYTNWETATDTPPELKSLAVFLPYVMRIRPLSFFPRLGKLRGLRIVANQLLGDNTDDLLNEFVRAVANLLDSGSADCILFDDLELESPLRKALENFARDGGRLALFCLGKPQRRWRIDFPNNPDDYWKQFTSKTRGNLRSSAKKLRHRLSRFDSEEQVPAFLEKACQVSKNSWQAKRLGLRMSNSVEQKSFWQVLARQGAMRSYILEQDDTPLAFQAGVQWKGTFYMEETGYDLAYSAQSPGTVMTFRVFEDLLHHNRPQRADFGFGDSEYKSIFGNRQTLSGFLLVASRRLRPLLTIQLDNVSRWLHERARGFVGALGLHKRMRQVFRRR